MILILASFFYRLNALKLKSFSKEIPIAFSLTLNQYHITSNFDFPQKFLTISIITSSTSQELLKLL